MLREATPALGCKPVYLAPLDASNSLVDDVLSVDLGSEPQKECDCYYSDIEDHGDDSNDRYLLE